MRALTPAEAKAAAIAEKHRRAAQHYRIRLSAVSGMIDLMDDLLASIDKVSRASRATFEPRILEHKARHLRARVGLTPVVRFLQMAQRRTIDPIVGVDS
jgi:hypothetical protein